jgi:hypothetical protein
VRPVEEVFPVAQRRFRILVDRHDYRLHMVVGPPFTGRHVPHVRERLDPRKIVGFLVVLFQRSLPTTAQPRAARRRFCIFRLGGTFTARDLVPRRWLSLSRSSTVGRRSQFPFTDKHRHFPAHRQQAEGRFRAVPAFV